MLYKNIKKYIYFLIVLTAPVLFEQCSAGKILTSSKNEHEIFINDKEAKIIPAPVYDKYTGTIFSLTPSAKIYIDPSSLPIKKIALYLQSKLRPSTGYTLDIADNFPNLSYGNIYLSIISSDSALGSEGYKLTVSKDSIYLRAFKPEGLFRGVQTIRQLFPSAIESSSKRYDNWNIESRIIIDYPRYRWRGAMLDVARHFFSVKDVEKYIDILALYKINVFHIHLTDDQGWRIMIHSWKNLAEYGGSTATGGDPGGYYTQKDFSEIVDYAKDRYINIVPEIDMPAHTNAALASYAVLNCDGKAPHLYGGTNVGFCSLCLDSPITYTFLDGVIKELAAITPGNYIHIGGDEARTLAIPKYAGFIDKVEKIVHKYGKKVIGWEEIRNAKVDSGTIVQFWANSNLAKAAAKAGMKLVLSPASKIYLDMKYDSATTIGQNWAGYVTVKTAYDWDPLDFVDDSTEKNIVGVEAPLWTETIKTLSDIEYMVFPRILCAAEIGWSQKSRKNWNDFAARLSLQGSRWNIMGVNYYKSKEINWIK